jgi:sulfur-oxidizing protein SoxB
LKNNKKYTISGWASVNSIESGKPIWDITREYLSDIKYYDLDEVKQPRILQEGDNFGLET